ncbi:hypothetical protein EON63_15090 [archaeon]|nr:MAG: hypothetical protein EON63_15090 [archaeon]
MFVCHTASIHNIHTPPPPPLYSLSFANNVGFPVLVRPSFVLSGAAMSVATNEEQLLSCLQSAEEVWVLCNG